MALNITYSIANVTGLIETNDSLNPGAYYPTVLGLASGGFVVGMYDSLIGDPPYAITRFFDASYLPTTPGLATSIPPTNLSGGESSLSLTQLANGTPFLVWDDLATNPQGHFLIEGSGPVTGVDTNLGFGATRDHGDPQVAGLKNGGFVLATVSAGNIYWDRYDDLANPFDFKQVDTAPSGGTQNNPVVAALDDGGWVVAYVNNTDIRAAVYNSDGSVRKADFLVADQVGGGGSVSGDENLSSPRLAALPGGGFAVSFAGGPGGGVGGNYNIYLSTFTPGGAVASGPAKINTDALPAGTYGRGDLAVLDNGYIVATWALRTDLFGDLYGRVFDNSTPVTDPFLIRDQAGTKNAYADISGLTGGRYVTTFDGSEADYSNKHIYSRVQEVYRHGTGTADQDVYNGDELKDDLSGGGGPDILTGGRNVDVLKGEAGDDLINGNEDRDFIYGGTEKDTLKGAGGDDVLEGGSGDDTLYGEDGSDRLLGGPGLDTLQGGADNDTYLLYDVTYIGPVVEGGGAPPAAPSAGPVIPGLPTYAYDEINDSGGIDLVLVDRVTPGIGSYTLPAAVENGNIVALQGMTLNGNESPNLLNGFVGPDTLNGLGGVDVIFADDGADTISGGEDNDALVGGAGGDSITGGNGADYLFGPGFQNSGAFAPDSGNDNLDGGEDADGLWGGDGGDVLSGGGAADSLVGGADADQLIGGEGDDFAFGGEFSFVDGSRMPESGADVINGDGGKDALYGFDGDDLISGDAGDDYVEAGEGADTVNGGADNDTLLGQDGADIMNGGAGFDYLYGGTGADTFDFNVGDSYDTVWDFTLLPGEELLLDPAFGVASLTEFRARSITFNFEGRDFTQFTSLDGLDQITIANVRPDQITEQNFDIG